MTANRASRRSLSRCLPRRSASAPGWVNRSGVSVAACSSWAFAFSRCELVCALRESEWPVCKRAGGRDWRATANGRLAR